MLCVLALKTKSQTQLWNCFWLFKEPQEWKAKPPCKNRAVPRISRAPCNFVPNTSGCVHLSFYTPLYVCGEFGSASQGSHCFSSMHTQNPSATCTKWINLLPQSCSLLTKPWTAPNKGGLVWRNRSALGRKPPRRSTTESRARDVSVRSGYT